MTRTAWIVLALTGCSSRAPTPPLAHVVATPATPTPADAPRAHPVDATCPIRWDELEASAPARIPLVAATAAPSDECPSQLGVALVAPGGCIAPDCVLGVDAQGRRIAFVMDGPDGSGHYSTLGVVVAGAQPLVGCVGASTVAWRHLYRVAKMLAPLTYFGDVDGNGTSELVAWQRLPWGDAEIDNAMVPIVYAIEGNDLVRRDAIAGGLARRTGAAFEKLLALGDTEGDFAPLACYRAAANALNTFGD